MSSWQDIILGNFFPNVSKLTLVADPDSLLTEEKLTLKLHERGFDLLEFNDPIEFRYAYESKYRSSWDQGENTDLVVILHLQNAELDFLPYDLLQAGRKLSFNLGELFPNLSYPVIEKLDRSLLEPLYEAQCKSQPDRMGDNATKDFILRHVFGIATELIANDVELLRALLRIHYGINRIPPILTERLIQVFQSNKCFKSWPLDEIIPDDKSFFDFLQDHWPIFLTKHCKKNQGNEEAADYDVKHLTGGYLPFDHQDIKVYIDNLFIEGKLTPVQASGIEIPADSWIRSGISPITIDVDEQRISRFFELIKKELPTEESRYSDWILFALKWAELSSLVHCGSNVTNQTLLKEVSDTLNTIFAGWLSKHYAGLINLPPTSPAMLHHVPRRLARDMEDTNSSRVALLVVDGLSLDQWVTVRHILQKQDPNLIMRESATFAWVPTLTSVSRQSIFSGKPPLYFPSSINSTNTEEKLWRQFWESHGLSRLDVTYQRGLGDGDASSVLEAAIHPGKTRVIGLVIDKVDKIMHGMQLGSAGMHNQIKQWCQRGFLVSLIGYLLDHEYEVWLTADHGNIECTGKGKPSEGVIAEIRGERARVYPSHELRSQVASSFKFAYEWQPVGLPPNYFPLVASNHDAFTNLNDSVVGHGGIAIEEVIVPLIKFERNKSK
ncbi:BREX-3 system phosphatase PglZ [Legionella pneumophila]|uniref:BREX-3 system phosphatase PglZ n=1 Tax=Legionella pneumophila TaxID=446 RepID=UPI00077745CB|nr:BREX-3 system phosphatase PglZ [Legionella pneumophila]HAT8643602.1 BREX-3 system phosphatase PglZ [Legionella pneumophila]